MIQKEINIALSEVNPSEETNNSFIQLILLDPNFKKVINTPEYFLQNEIKFIYLYTFKDYYKVREVQPNLPPTVLEAVRLGFCKVVFNYLLEGDINLDYDYNKFIEFGKVNGLNKYSFIFFHGNYSLENIDNPYVTFKGNLYFEHTCWFNYFSRGWQEDVERVKNTSLEWYNYQKECTKTKYINCLNRVPRVHRNLLFSLLYTDQNIIDNSIVSFGGINLLEDKVPSHHLGDHEYLSTVGSFVDFLAKYGKEYTDGLEVDAKMDINHAVSINLNFYNDTYITLTTETLAEEGQLFFSEKTFKPISVGHPFIHLGGKGSLAKLKEFGYKTFDNWWDESYDSIHDWRDRVQAVQRLTSKICAMEGSTVKSMVDEMEEVVLHNIDNYYNNNRLYEYLDELHFLVK